MLGSAHSVFIFRVLDESSCVVLRTECSTCRLLLPIYVTEPEYNNNSSGKKNFCRHIFFSLYIYQLCFSFVNFINDDVVFWDAAAAVSLVPIFFGCVFIYIFYICSSFCDHNEQTNELTTRDKRVSSFCVDRDELYELAPKYIHIVENQFESTEANDIA